MGLNVRCFSFFSQSQISSADKALDSEENLQDLEDLLYDMGMLEEDPELSEDTNIWEEPEEDNIVFAPDGKIRGGTLNQLVLRLTNEKDHGLCFLRISS